jgi:hypothetical protein
VLFVLRAKQAENLMPAQMLVVGVVCLWDWCTALIVLSDLSDFIPTGAVVGVFEAWVIWLKLDKGSDLIWARELHDGGTYSKQCARYRFALRKRARRSTLLF